MAALRVRYILHWCERTYLLWQGKRMIWIDDFCKLLKFKVKNYNEIVGLIKVHDNYFTPLV